MSRARLRIGRMVRYLPTTSEQSSGSSGTAIPGIITKVASDGSCSVSAFQGDGTVLAKTSIKQGNAAGSFDFRKVPSY